MNPAASVIFFTTASGAGYGLLALIGLLGPFGVLPDERWFGGTGLAVALVLITAGLVSSTLHLGHPERAWRALSQWRSSWLSREGVMALVTYLPAGLLGAAWARPDLAAAPPPYLEIIGGLTALSAVLTVFCTGKIYATLRSVPRWSNGWVVPLFLCFALMTGVLWLNALLQMFGNENHWAAWSRWLAMAVLVLAWGLKAGYWRSMARKAPSSTPESATGLGHLGRVELLDRPHTGDNYLLREMGYRIARKHRHKLQKLAVLLGFAIPFGLQMLGFYVDDSIPTTLGAALLAAGFGMLGVYLERWLFFAEAKHVMAHYYGHNLS